MPDNTLDFRAAVMRELWARNMTIEDLAKAINHSRPYVSHIINGRAANPDTMQKIRSYLGLDTVA